LCLISCEQQNITVC